MTYRRGIAALALLGAQLAAMQPAAAGPGLCEAEPLEIDADPVFSPRQDDGRFDTATVRYELSRAGTLHIEIRKGEAAVSTILEDALPAGTGSASWDGHDDAGTLAGSGSYRVVATLRSDGCLDANAEATTRVDNRAPSLDGLTAPRRVALAAARGQGSPFAVSWDALDEPATLHFSIRSQSGRRIHQARRDDLDAGAFAWAARHADGGLYPPGVYRWRLRAVDAVGNVRSLSPRDVGLHYRACGSGGPIRTFGVHVDGALAITKPVFAARLFSILCEPRGWTRSDSIRWRYEPDGTTLVGLRTADHTEERCLQLVGLSVRRYFSCGTFAEVVLNADRWFRGSDFLTLSVARYRRLLVNHELGHAIGQGHRGCPGRGRNAPVMMQQSKGLHGCIANEYPTGSELAAI